MRPILVLTVAAAVAAAATPAPALACSVCGCGDPLLGASDPAAITGRVRLQLDGEYLQVDAGNEADPARTDRLTQWSYRLNAVVRPTETLSLSATLPVVSKELRTLGGGPGETSRATALGDVEVGARWAFWRSVRFGVGRVQELAVSAGTSAPTGPDDVRAGGVRIDEHGQPGTGSWGPFAGLHYRFEQGRWLAFASLSGRVHGTNGFDYTYGPALLWSAHGQLVATRRVVLDLGLDGRHAGADRAAGEAVVNTGGTVLSVSPGVYANVLGPGWLFVRAQLPVHAALRGDQAVYPTVVAGIQAQLL